MAFVGVGDHGGGPTEQQIAWCREHAEAIAGARLAFSSPSRFFDAVEQEGAALPEVIGELQHHAVGCYSVLRAIKVGMRHAEEALAQAEIVAAADPAPDAHVPEQLAEGWRTVAFNAFHDILGGTCVPRANAEAIAELGGVRAAAEQQIRFGLRRMAAQLPDDERQRIVLFNASDAVFDGYSELAPWTEGRWRRHWRFIDEKGAVVEHQPIAQEAATPFPRRVLMRLAVAPRSSKILRLDREGDAADDSAPPRPPPTAPALAVQALRLGQGVIDFAPDAGFKIGDLTVAPRFELFDDPTDTWAHGVDRLGESRVAVAAWEPPAPIDDGPLMRSALQRGMIGDSMLSAEWRLYADEPVVELRLGVHWRARHRLLKLVLPLDLVDRIDGVMGEPLARALDGGERPLQDFVWFRLRGGRAFGVVCPDVFGLDADADGARLTLLRSPLEAHHDPAPADAFPRAAAADQGAHHFRFQFAAFDGLTPGWLKLRAGMAHRPLIACDWTKGMVPRDGA